MMKNCPKYLAEFIGTFALTLMVTLSLTSEFPLATPIIAGLVVGLFVYTVGNISGTHLNPAVTVALASIRKISPVDALVYIVVQILGALAAMWVAKSYGSGFLPTILVSDSLRVGAAEAMGAFMLVFGISAVVHGRVHSAASGLTIGTSLLLGILAASVASNGVLNPAVAIGIGSVSAMYLLAPIVGAVAAAWVYKYLNGVKA